LMGFCVVDGFCVVVVDGILCCC